jgi:hypothetical protein
MPQGVPLIYQGVLWDAENRTYGIPDFLVRSDELARLFPSALSREEAALPANDLGGARWHYRVVDLKYTTLELLAGGELGNNGSAPAYKGQLFIYNRALGRIQGYLPPTSYLIGRGWRQTRQSVTRRGDSAMDVLAPVIQESTLQKGMSLELAVSRACEWIRRVRLDGEKWSALPKPTLSELRPNMGHGEDSPWSDAKKQIADKLEELTLLWYVGVEKRQDANNLGIFRLRDPKCTASSLGVTGQKIQPTLQAILDVNQTDKGPPVAPKRIHAAEKIWRSAPPLEFYVDFETLSDLNDDFSSIPKRGGHPLIFMIGCGHMEKDGWNFRCFIADALTEVSEGDVIEAWFDHMNDTRNRLAPDSDPLVIHWSQAEISTLVSAYNAAVQRQPERAKKWRAPNWFDFLNAVMKAEPVVVRGALGFGLKAVAQAMFKLGLIQTKWKSGPVDGLGAMVGAWRCAEEAVAKKAILPQIDLMKGIQEYNEVDCKVMMEIVRYLRTNH